MADPFRCQADGCLATSNHPRHTHAATDLRAAGVFCWCGANRWVIAYGGGLPAIIRCDQCSASVLIEPHLRKCGRAAARIAGV